MRVCIISSRFYPQLVGSGTSAYVIAKELSLRGHEVCVLTDSTLMHSPAHLDLNFDIHYIDELENFSMGKSSMKRPIEGVSRVLSTLKPNIIHVCNFMPMMLVSVIRETIQCPVVFTFFNTPVIGKRVTGYFSDSALDTLLGRFIIRSSAYDKLILGSRHYVEAAVSLGATPEKIQLSYLAPDVESFSDGPLNAKSILQHYFQTDLSDCSYILLPSRITEQKGILEAVRALSDINRHFSYPIKLMLTGMAEPFNAEYAEEVWRQAARLGVGELLLVPNRTIDRTDLSIFFKSAQLVLVPSWYEGLGLAAIESQYLGVPLAVSDTIGLNEVVSHGENGTLFEPRSPDSIAHAVINIIENPHDTSCMTENAKETVRKFSLDTHIGEIETAYEKLLRGEV